MSEDKSNSVDNLWGVAENKSIEYEFSVKDISDNSSVIDYLDSVNKEALNGLITLLIKQLIEGKIMTSEEDIIKIIDTVSNSDEGYVSSQDDSIGEEYLSSNLDDINSKLDKLIHLAESGTIPVNYKGIETEDKVDNNVRNNESSDANNLVSEDDEDFDFDDDEDDEEGNAIDINKIISINRKMSGNM